MNRSIVFFLAAAAYVSLSAIGCGSGAEPGAAEQIGSTKQAVTLANGVAYAYVESNATVPSAYTYDSYGGTVSALIEDPTTSPYYVVTVPGFNPGDDADLGYNIQAVAVGSADHCSVSLQTGFPNGDGYVANALGVHVICMNPGGTARVESAFSLLVEYMTGTESSPDRGGYLATEYTSGTIAPGWSWNSAGGTNSVSRTGTGAYTVTLGSLTSFSNAGVLVTAENSTYYCKVSHWSYGVIYVNCYNYSGSLVDGTFAVSFFEQAPHQSFLGGHGWVDSTTTVSSAYQSETTFSFSTCPGSTISVSESSDVYTVNFGDWVDEFAGPDCAFAVGYGANSNYCNVVGWYEDGSYNEDVQVECYTYSGTATTSLFDVSYLTDATGNCF